MRLGHDVGVEVTIDRGVATVRPASAEVAAALLAVAERGEVQTSTSGATLAFVVPERVAERAGLVEGAIDPAKRDAGASGGGTGGKHTEQPDTPHRGASRAAWVEFLNSQNIAHSDDDRRDDLVALWESRT